MKATIALKAKARAATDNVKALRLEGFVPGVVYGAVKNTPITVALKDLHNVYMKAGENTLVEVDMDGKNIPCLIHAISMHPVTDKEEHVDFYAVDMSKKVTTNVPVVFEGESPAVKTLGGILVTVHDTLTVQCLPKDLPEKFVIDITVLENFHQQLTVANLKVPEGVTIQQAPDVVIVTVQEPRKEEVVEVVAAATDAAAAGAEGAPAADGAAPAAGAAAPAAEKKEEKKK